MIIKIIKFLEVVYMLKLNAELFVGKGLHREVYLHPDEKNLCVKVALADGGREEMDRERAFYKTLQRRNISWAILPRYHGRMETNRGPGSVFDLVRDFNGEISKTLDYYLSSSRETIRNYNGLIQAIPNLRNTMLQESIITLALDVKNIVYRRINSTAGILMLIDNVGNYDFITIADHIRYFAEKKIIRKWHRFESSLISVYPDNSLLSALYPAESPAMPFGVPLLVR